MARRRLLKSYFYIIYNDVAYGETVNVSPYDSTGGIDTFSLASTSSWHVISNSASEWLHLDITAGTKGNADVQMTADPNPEQTEKTGTVVVGTDDGRYSIRLNVKLNGQETVSYQNFRIVVPTSQTALTTADTVNGVVIKGYADKYIGTTFIEEVDVTSATTWSVDNVSIIRIGPDGNTTQTVYPVYDQSTYHPTQRNGIVTGTFSGDSDTQNFSVAPEGRVEHSLEVTANDYDISWSGETRLDVIYNTFIDGVWNSSARTGYDYSTSTDPGDILDYQGSGRFTANNSGSTSQNVTITVTYRGVSDSVDITVQGKPQPQVVYSVELSLSATPNYASSTTVSWSGSAYLYAYWVGKIDGSEVSREFLRGTDGVTWATTGNSGTITNGSASDSFTAIFQAENISTSSELFRVDALYNLNRSGRVNITVNGVNSLAYALIASASPSTIAYNGSSQLSAVYVTIIDGNIVHKYDYNLGPNETTWTASPQQYCTINENTDVVTASNNTNTAQTVRFEVQYNGATGYTDITINRQPEYITYGNLRFLSGGTSAGTEVSAITIGWGEDDAENIAVFADVFDNGVFVETRNVTTGLTTPIGSTDFTVYSSSTIQGTFTCDTATGTKFTDSEDKFQIQYPSNNPPYLNFRDINPAQSQMNYKLVAETSDEETAELNITIVPRPATGTIWIEGSTAFTSAITTFNSSVTIYDVTWSSEIDGDTVGAYFDPNTSTNVSSVTFDNGELTVALFRNDEVSAITGQVITVSGLSSNGQTVTATLTLTHNPRRVTALQIYGEQIKYLTASGQSVTFDVRDQNGNVLTAQSAGTSGYKISTPPIFPYTGMVTTAYDQSKGWVVTKRAARETDADSAITVTFTSNEDSTVKTTATVYLKPFKITAEPNYFLARLFEKTGSCAVNVLGNQYVWSVSYSGDINTFGWISGQTGTGNTNFSDSGTPSFDLNKSGTAPSSGTDLYVETIMLNVGPFVDERGTTGLRASASTQILLEPLEPIQPTASTYDWGIVFHPAGNTEITNDIEIGYQNYLTDRAELTGYNEFGQGGEETVGRLRCLKSTCKINVFAHSGNTVQDMYFVGSDISNPIYADAESPKTVTGVATARTIEVRGNVSPDTPEAWRPISEVSGVCGTCQSGDSFTLYIDRVELVTRGGKTLSASTFSPSTFTIDRTHPAAIVTSVSFSDNYIQTLSCNTQVIRENGSFTFKVWTGNYVKRIVVETVGLDSGIALDRDINVTHGAEQTPVGTIGNNGNGEISFPGSLPSAYPLDFSGSYRGRGCMTLTAYDYSNTKKESLSIDFIRH